jgi:hypothetical protein
VCGTIKYEGISRKIGDLVEYEVPPTRAIWTAPWLGHCREESGIPENATEVKIFAGSYTEKGVEFSVPPGKKINAYLIKSPHFPGGEGIFLITRPVTQEELKRCQHPRHPKY